MKLSKTKVKINAVEIDDCFMCRNNLLTHFKANNLDSVGNDFMYRQPKKKRIL